MVEDDYVGQNGHKIVEAEVKTEEELQVDKLLGDIEQLGFEEEKKKKLKIAFGLVDKGAMSVKKDGRGMERNKRKDKVTLELAHPVAVAVKVKEIAERHKEKLSGSGAEDPVFEAVLAGLLHDYIEDVKDADKFVGAVFGGDMGMQLRVEGWVMGVTKQELLERTVSDGYQVSAKKIGEVIGKKDGSDYEDKGLDKRIRKDLEDEATFTEIRRLASEGDFVPLMIKTADRFHNLETIGGMDPVRQVEVVQQTREKIIPTLLEFGFTKEAEDVKEKCDEITPVASIK